METAFVSEGLFARSEFHRWLERVPENDPNRYELLGGRIAMTPPPAWPHSAVAMNVAFHVRLHTDAHLPGGRVQESSAGFDLPTGDCVQPDVSWFSKDTLQRGPAPIAGKRLALAPDLVVEVLSPATRRIDLTTKREAYERSGVAEYWVVDPNRRSVVIFALDQPKPGGRPCFDAGTIWASGPAPSRLFPGIDFSIEQVFA